MGREEGGRAIAQQGFGSSVTPIFTRRGRLCPPLVWPHWWSFADASQQGVDFSKKISKIKIIFWFDFHRCLGTILENKVVQKLKFSINEKNKKNFF